MKELIKKTGLLMLMLMAGLSFASCSDDDEGTSIPQDLVGTWKVTASHYAEYKNGSMIYENTDGEVGAVWKLDANGSITGGYIANGTWSVSGNQFLVTTTDDGETYTERFTLTRNGNDEVTIKSDITYNEDGSTWREVYELILTRQGTSGGNGDGNGGNGGGNGGNGGGNGGNGGGNNPGGSEGGNPQPTFDIPTTDPGTTGVTVNRSDVIGTWTMIGGYEAAYIGGSLVDKRYNTDSEDIGSAIIIKSDGTFTNLSDGESGTWQLNGPTLTMTYYDEDEDGPVNLTIAWYNNDKMEVRAHYYEYNGSITIHGIESVILQRS